MLRFTDEGIKTIVSRLENQAPSNKEYVMEKLREIRAENPLQLQEQLNKYITLKKYLTEHEFNSWVETNNPSYLSLEENTQESVLKIDILRECRKQLAQRYAIKTFTQNIALFSKNFIADDLYPSIMWEQLLPAGDYRRREKSVKAQLQKHKYKYTPYTLNKGMSISQGIPYIPMIDKVAMLGYNFAEIKANLKKIREKNYAFFFIGLGGMCLNVIQNLQELLQEAKMKSLFKCLGITEFDTIAYHNLPRFNTAAYLEETNVVLNENDYLTEFQYIVSSDTLNGYGANNITRELYKTNLLNTAELNHLSTNTVYIQQKKITCESNIYNFIDNTLRRSQNIGKKIFFGSPEVATRNLFSTYARNPNNNSHFLCATHSDNEVSLIHNPNVEGANLIVESYGTITLTTLNLNILKATIELINVLANRDDLEDGEKLLEHTFDELKTTKYWYNPNNFELRQGVEI